MQQKTGPLPAAPLPFDPRLSLDSEVNLAARAWIERRQNPHRSKAIRDFSGDSLLDVGCGNGQYVLGMAGERQTSGVDIQAYPQWELDPDRFQVADAKSLPFEEESFDTIASFETLEHVPDPEDVLREFRRVTRRNIIVSVPNCEIPSAMEKSRLAFFHYTDRSHVNFFTRETLAEALISAGFEPVAMDLINACAIRPILDDISPFPSWVNRIAHRFVRHDPWCMTILAVAEKR